MATTPLATSDGFRVFPATHARFDDVRTMVGPKNPASNVCWCLSHRIPAKENRELAGPDRGAFVERYARQANATELRIDVLGGNHGARELYRQAGFRSYAETLSMPLADEASIGARNHPALA